MFVCQTQSIVTFILRDFYVTNENTPFLVPTGFGFSDKPQPGYGFDYSLPGNCFFSPCELITG